MHQSQELVQVRVARGIWRVEDDCHPRHLLFDAIGHRPIEYGQIYPDSFESQLLGGLGENRIDRRKLIDEQFDLTSSKKLPQNGDALQRA